ncbi:hypothetical protein B0A52_07248 [Exophiala mesophila]|uniref:Uncharacterized protein n=1 Tax=Exophiala mesophila TaxID=212818 RepID=A0A438MZ43_EXOME|nr:hypothetical protein B0A52_07248 [Exophiala mesophila]
MCEDEDEFGVMSLETSDSGSRRNRSARIPLPWMMVVFMLAMARRVAGNPIEVMRRSIGDRSTAISTPEQAISIRQVNRNTAVSPAPQISDTTIWVFLVAFAVASSGAIWNVYVRIGMKREAVREVDKQSELAMKAGR